MSTCTFHLHVARIRTHALDLFKNLQGIIHHKRLFALSCSLTNHHLRREGQTVTYAIDTKGNSYCTFLLLRDVFVPCSEHTRHPMANIAESDADNISLHKALLESMRTQVTSSLERTLQLVHAHPLASNQISPDQDGCPVVNRFETKEQLVLPCYSILRNWNVSTIDPHANGHMH